MATTITAQGDVNPKPIRTRSRTLVLVRGARDHAVREPVFQPAVEQRLSLPALDGELLP